MFITLNTVIIKTVRCDINFYCCDFGTVGGGTA